MKRKRFFSKSASRLIVVVLAIVMFTREPLKMRLLVAAFAVWGVCLVIHALRSSLRTNKERRSETP
jgi:hypothetical protein